MVKCKAVICGIPKMNDAKVLKFKELILARLSELEKEDALGEQGQATVELDQQAVGRLSRMDALQNQAMAKAGLVRRQQERTRLYAALDRMPIDEFGYCEDCGESIVEGRLWLDPSAVRCIECANG